MKQTAEITDLTVCRGVFAAWVFIYHVDLYLGLSRVLGPARDLIGHGYLGVDGFFILSGLILGRVYTPPPTTLRLILLFWGRRLARLYPVHLATLVLLGALVIAGHAAGAPTHDPERFSLVSLAENLVLIQGWGVASVGQWNYPSWSISSEWAGYLAFPLLGWLIAYFEALVSLQIILVTFTALGLIAFLHHGQLNLAFNAGLWRYFPEFIAGLAAARTVPRVADNAPKRVLLGVGIALVLIFAAIGADFGAVLALWLVLYTLVLQADAELPPMLRGTSWLRGLGLISYSFYMSFAVIELILTRLLATPADHPAAFVLGMLAGTFALALVLYFAVERPARRLIDGWLDALRPHG
jgi:peptidoglycan/LPS O-acetylase OafA/YrhL